MGEGLVEWGIGINQFRKRQSDIRSSHARSQINLIRLEGKVSGISSFTIVPPLPYPCICLSVVKDSCEQSGVNTIESLQGFHPLLIGEFWPPFIRAMLFQLS